MKKTYEWILFDADETLFHFNDADGLKNMFADFGIDFTEKDYHEYQAVNKPLWVEYQNGTITSEQIHVRRFQSWADKLQMLPHDLNTAFIHAMSKLCSPIQGAISLIQQLKNKTKMGIITNGYPQLLHARLAHTNLTDHFDVLVASEAIGIAKPHPAIFDHALSLMGNPARDKVLMVGDNLDSDILGAINSGMHSCWINWHKKTAPEGIRPHYEVASLQELQALLL